MTLIDRTRARIQRRKWLRPRTQIDKAANGGIIAILSLVLFSIQLFQFLFYGEIFMNGKFVKCECNTRNPDEITLEDDGVETTTSVQGATVTLNGKAAKLSDLKAGDSVSLTGDPVTAVAATRP